MRLLIQLDGLLKRFGRIVPDAIAMIECIRLIQSRLNASGRDTDISPLLFRLPGDHLSPCIGQCGYIVLPDENSELKHYFGFTDKSLSISDDFLSLITGLNEHQRQQLLVLTTNVDMCRRCIAAGVEVIRVADSGSQTERWAAYSDVMRLLEEHLHIPTARPMADDVRTGALLAIQARDVCAAWEHALTLIREDTNADWIVLDNVLILYTENPDLEDSLEAQADVERLSLAVHKFNLRLSTNREISDKPVLYQSGCFSLEDAGTKQQAGADTLPGQQSWKQIHRRIFNQDEYASDKKNKKLAMRAKKLLISAEVADTILTLLAVDVRFRPQKIRDFISASLNYNVSADCYYVDDGPQAITWMTNYGATQKDQLVAIHYRLSNTDRFDEADKYLFARALQGILAINQWLGSVDERLAVLHCFALQPDTSLDSILDSTLLVQERNRLTRIIEFDQLLTDSSRDEMLTFYADQYSRDLLDDLEIEYPSIIWRALPGNITAVSRIRLLGGHWCQAPDDTQATRIVQTMLQALLT